MSLQDRPNARELLEIARATLNAELPLLPADRRLVGLMVANALAIATRELDLQQSYVEASTTEIRAGRHDGNQGLYQALLTEARRRVEIANPKYLTGDDQHVTNR
jgi:hypothetical protein